MTVEPLLTNMLAWTNQYHGLIRSSPGTQSRETVELLSYDWGVWMWISTIYVFLLFFLFAIGYTVMAFGINRYNLFRSNPATYKTIIDNVMNGIIVLDSMKRIGDVFTSCGVDLHNVTL